MSSLEDLEKRCNEAISYFIGIKEDVNFIQNLSKNAELDYDKYINKFEKEMATALESQSLYVRGIENLAHQTGEQYDKYVEKLKSICTPSGTDHHFIGRMMRMEDRISALETKSHGSGEKVPRSIGTYQEERS